MAELQADSCKRQADRRTPSGWFPRRWVRAAFPVVVLAAVGCWLLAAPAAQALDTGLQFGTATGLTTQDIRVTVAKIIRALIGILGLVALVIVLYGGFLWMTSGGNEEKIEKGKQVLTNGAIGLAVIFLSLGITQFIISRLTQALSVSGSVITAGGFVEDVFLTGALGAGPVESHFPPRSAADIPRNTRIFVTFREAIDPTTIAANSNGNVDAQGQPIIGTTGENSALFDNYQDLALPESIQVMRVGANVDPTKLTPAARTANPTAFAAEAAKLTTVGVAIAPGGKTIILSPVQTEVKEVGGPLSAKVNLLTGSVERALLGSADAPSAYIVRLTGGIKKATRRADGTPEELFTGAFREYSWDFSVSTILDLTPPQITSVVPFPDAGQDVAAGVVGVPDQPRNVIVQLNFNEAVDPTVTTGVLTAADIATITPPTTGFRHLAVKRVDPVATHLPGSFVMSNQYRTVEFTTDSACGQNTCGGTVYCLPGNAVLLSYAEAARLEAGGPAGLPFSGVMDAAGNSLDGNGDAAAGGPGPAGTRRFDRGGTAAENAGASDSVQWQFATNDTIDLTAPEIREVVHQLKSTGRAVYPGTIDASLALVENVALNAPIEVLFSKLMSGSVTSGVGLSEATGCHAATGAGCLWFMSSAEHEDTGRDTDQVIDATRMTMSHATFRDVETGFGLPPQYRVRVDSGVRDIYQNCMFTIVNQAADPPTELAPSARGPQGPIGGHRCVGAPTAETCTPPLP